MTTFYSDLDITLSTAKDGDITLDTNEDAIKNSLSNILSTMQGSRRMLPLFAFNAYNLLFDPIDETTSYSIGEVILDSIENWEDRITINDIYVIPKEDDNRYDITLLYTIKNTGQDVVEKFNYILYKL